MKLSTRSRYGARLMLELALHYGKGPIFLGDIARLENISEKYLSQIIIPLRRAGLVISERGAHGGYMLNRSPEKISLKEIVWTLESYTSLVDCLTDEDSCERRGFCVTRSVWKRLRGVIKKELERITLADLLRDHKKGSRKSGS